MTYRDRPIDCPRCRTNLVRLDKGERWACRSCKGLLAGVTEVIDELLAVAPHLAPASGIGDLSTFPRRAPAEEEIACPVCADPMEPIFLGGKSLDRCRHDQLIWFDDAELDQVLEVARGQPRRSWLARFFGGN
ncbi:MAG: zf-TFIIB domain-containing protein [Kofleriaceae bacterium]